ncbi:hypothetical protein CDL15_Pgr008591 [Punica granatum]|uniref:Uncharacterized protein n=1 Tax=Punica granatum TaxID=22663 RepID=A0A218WN39_PUNGR|nr:hypothetical protein CDL15_Pgr008591 [Punica granatum]
MDIDNPHEDKESSGHVSPVKENGHLPPVSPDTSGEGFPYAPENFPNPGDNWRWRVGKRVAITGNYYRDRYLYAPKSLKHLLPRNNLGANHGFASKPAVERFIKAEFPDADLNAFFASFSWKIPSKKLLLANGIPDRHTFFIVPCKESPEPSSSDPGPARCKAKNRTCISLSSESDQTTLPSMSCDICCSEPGFCRDCCCILCSKTVDSSHGGYSFIKCEALIGKENSICGHLAHLNCGLRAYTAGTVGGSIGLDAEYYCRRCDSRTELVSHVTKLYETCKSIDSQDEVEKVLNMGVSVLQGSQKTSAKLLLSNIYSALSKLKRGNSLEEIWRGENCLVVPISSNGSNRTLPIKNGSPFPDDLENENLADAAEQIGEPSNESTPFSGQIHYQKLATEITRVLQAMRQAQESEYKMAEERLHAQKNYLHNLYQQLEYEISELREQGLSNGSRGLVKSVSKRKDQIRREYEKLLEMMEVAKGFGRTSKEILREHFSLGLEENHAEVMAFLQKAV